jgi:hypothetical protein
VSRLIRSWSRNDNGDPVPGAIRCGCGAVLEIWRPGGDVSCDCGREFNSSGQLLAPREQWGEETGEHPADCGFAGGDV